MINNAAQILFNFQKSSMVYISKYALNDEGISNNIKTV